MTLIIGIAVWAWIASIAFCALGGVFWGALNSTGRYRRANAMTEMAMVGFLIGMCVPVGLPFYILHWFAKNRDDRRYRRHQKAVG